MIRYQVSLEIGGKWIPVGYLSGMEAESVCFSYSESYLEDPEAAAISVSLPLQREPFSPLRTRTFFNGLLPEGFTRRAVAAWMRTDETDYISLLYGLGRECLGALRISLEEEAAKAAYEKLSLQEVKALAAEGAEKSAEILLQTHLSLTGASGKAGLYYYEPDQTWYLPFGTAPSTHIVKQSHVRLKDIVTNEQLSQRTAYYLGIDVPESFIVNTGAGREEEILFATKRYDREFSEAAGSVNGLPRPLRLHQEDFAQAMGIPSSGKYERDAAQAYLKEMFALLRRCTAHPIEDSLKLWDRIVFAWLLGNTDAHIKNLSLLYSPDLKSMRLAPAYDLVSTCIYPSGTRIMSFSIGGESDIRRITEENFRQAARDAGIGWKLAQSRLKDLQDGFPGALRKATEELAAAGFFRAEEIAEKIKAARTRSE